MLLDFDYSLLPNRFFAWPSQLAFFWFSSPVSWLLPHYIPGIWVKDIWELGLDAQTSLYPLTLQVISSCLKGFTSCREKWLPNFFSYLDLCPWTPDLHIQQPTCIFTGMFNRKIKQCTSEIKVIILVLKLALLLVFSSSVNGSFFLLVTQAENLEVFLDSVSHTAHLILRKSLLLPSKHLWSWALFTTFSRPSHL